MTEIVVVRGIYVIEKTDTGTPDVGTIRGIDFATENRSMIEKDHEIDHETDTDSVADREVEVVAGNQGRFLNFIA